MIHNINDLIKLRLSPAQYSLTSPELWPKTQSFYFISSAQYSLTGAESWPKTPFIHSDSVSGSEPLLHGVSSGEDQEAAVPDQRDHLPEAA